MGYISIAEFAELANITKQAVYQRLEKDLKEYVSVENGKKCINTEALQLFKQNRVEAIKQKNKETEQELNSKIQDLISENTGLKAENKRLMDLNELLNQQIKLLNDQVEKKDAEIKTLFEELKDKNRQIEDVHRLIDQQQQLNLVSQKLLEGKQDGSDQQPAGKQNNKQPEEKKSWFSRIIGR